MEQPHDWLFLHQSQLFPWNHVVEASDSCPRHYRRGRGVDLEDRRRGGVAPAESGGGGDLKEGEEREKRRVMGAGVF